MRLAAACVLVTLLGVGVGGCVKTEDLTAGQPLTGRYAGTIADSESGSGSMSLTLTQSGTDVQGTWSIAFATGGSTGTVGGTAGAAGADLVFDPAAANRCSFRATAFLGDNLLRGTYVGINCTRSFSGSLLLTRAE